MPESYGQFCPVAQAAEVLTERWTLLVVRELLMGSTRFYELQRGVHEGALPAVGDELGRSSVDGRPWVVRRIEESGRRAAIHVSKEGATGDPYLVKHHMTVPARVP